MYKINYFCWIVPKFIIVCVLDMPVRRHADPNNVQYIWDSIRSAKHHRHAADFQYITKFLQTETNYTSAQIELYISLTLKDGLIM